MTLSKRDVLALLDLHGLKPKRSLGQNFVIDANTVRKIAHLAGAGPGDHVLEIGAGVGSLSMALLETGADLTCVEIDENLVPILREQVEPKGARVIVGDAMKLDWAKVLSSASSWTLVANLPYNVATPLMCDLLDSSPSIEKLYVMVQREVAERFVAKPNTEAYGAVSVKFAYWAESRIVANVPPSVFMPRPRVDSSVVEVIRRPVPAVNPDEVEFDALFSLVREGFGYRRKQLQRSLRGMVALEAFVRAEISPAARPQELTIEQWGALARAAVAMQ